MQSLHPIRSCDQNIVLMVGTNPTCVRPYRYLAFQKYILEGLMSEMLEKVIISPSSSQRSYPVMLVRKKKTVIGIYV